MNNLISLKNISKSFSNNRKINVLKKINYSFVKGKIYSLVGPSGSGKSTLLNVLSMIDKPTTGSLLIGNTPVNFNNNSKNDKIRSSKIGIIYQQNNLLPDFTALENVYLAGLALTNDKKNSINRAKKIIKTINGIGATGKTTCIYNSFKMLIDKFVLDDGTPSDLLKQYDTKIYLYTDSEEACCKDNDPNCAEWKVSCDQAFDKWCQIKQNQDFAQIIKLENSDATRLIDCLEEGQNCVEVIEEPSTQTTIYIENKKSIMFSSENLIENVQNRNSINLDHYPEAKEALSITNYSIRFTAEEECFSFTGQNDIDILEHTLSLANDCDLVSLQKVKGTFTYNEGKRVIYEDKDIKLVLKNPVVGFTFTNKAEPKITHDYRKN